MLVDTPRVLWTCDGSVEARVAVGRQERHKVSGWRRAAATVGQVAEGGVDRLRLATRRRMGRLGRVSVHPYLGFGTVEALRLKGRVLRGDPIVVTAGDSVWRNLGNMLRRLESDEVGGATVRCRHGEVATDVSANEEGYFDLDLRVGETTVDGGRGPAGPERRRTAWVPVELELLDPPPRGAEPPARATGQVLVPRAARFGVISDLDDTVVRSEITDTLRMLRIALTSNPHTRLPFDGVADFYRALERGPDGDEGNPVFYVSSSPWNLHDLLVQFMTAHRVPIGPLILRDWSPFTIRTGGRQHKLDAIRTIFATYPDMEFVLIGDSGEHDPEIYAQVVRDAPGRVRAIYIRDVTLAPRRKQVLAIAEELLDLGAELLLTADTAEAAAHARRLGLVAG
jgi:phosphatidate phosphatase APP1